MVSVLDSPLVSWDRVLNRSEKGRLGIGSLKALNLAMLGKWWWRFLNDKNAMWVSVIKSLYREAVGCLALL